jgi:hypothetical protein
MANRKGKNANYYLHVTTQTTTERATRTELKIGDELMCSGRVGSCCPISSTRCVTLVTNPVILKSCTFTIYNNSNNKNAV